MHRATPILTAFRSYIAGGARSVVDKVDDKKLMQEMGGNVTKNETHDKVEAPQNYGFTSVVRPADKGKDGKIFDSAEAFFSFMGGSRSFPVCHIMDDRRFRLKELKEGDVAFFDWLQHQFHFNVDGGFLTGRTDKKLRFQLVEPPKEEKQQQQQQSGSGNPSPTQFAEGDSGSSSGQSGQQQQQKKKEGQKQRYKEESKQYIDMTKDTTEVKHDKKIVLNAPAIDYKTSKHVFEGDVEFKGKITVTKDILGKANLRIDGEGFKPSDGAWEAGGTGGGASTLTDDQQMHLVRKQAYTDKIRITEEGVFIDGDFTVTGNLTVTGVVRAKAFETVE